MIFFIYGQSKEISFNPAVPWKRLSVSISEHLPLLSEEKFSHLYIAKARFDCLKSPVRFSFHLVALKPPPSARNGRWERGAANSCHPILWNSCTVQPHGIIPRLSLSSALEDVPACSVWGHGPDVVWCLNTTWLLHQWSRQCAHHPLQQGILFLPQKQLISIHTPSVLNYDSMHYNSLKAVFLFKYVLSDWRHYEFNLGEDVCSGIHNAIQSCDLFFPCGFTVGYIRLGNS